MKNTGENGMSQPTGSSCAACASADCAVVVWNCLSVTARITTRRSECTKTKSFIKFYPQNMTEPEEELASESPSQVKKTLHTLPWCEGEDHWRCRLVTVCYSYFRLRRYPVSFHSLAFRTLTQKQTNKQKPKALAARTPP